MHSSFLKKTNPVGLKINIVKVDQQTIPKNMTKLSRTIISVCQRQARVSTFFRPTVVLRAERSVDNSEKEQEERWAAERDMELLKKFATQVSQHTAKSNEKLVSDVKKEVQKTQEQSDKKLEALQKEINDLKEMLKNKK
jgi:gas vesicle protein